MKPLVGIIMGSQSDWDTMRAAAEMLEQLGVAHEVRVVSAHRTPKRLVEYAESARERGLKVIIAGAGGAAHLPGMTASLTPLPVLGVPVRSKAMRGMDSLLSIGNGHAEEVARDVAAGRYFLRLSNRRIKQCLAALSDNDDAETTATADAVLERF